MVAGGVVAVGVGVDAGVGVIDGGFDIVVGTGVIIAVGTGVGTAATPT